MSKKIIMALSLVLLFCVIAFLGVVDLSKFIGPKKLIKKDNIQPVTDKKLPKKTDNKRPHVTSFPINKSEVQREKTSYGAVKESLIKIL